ncbi:tumor necrosis factor ligand superfamily member 9 [Perognathus longimembris pacificus]|uniref:tumor necrosis factor ligand superfamily member 9 n=1 Tax=Perognathus longimembris pacificus TaxID=214514 RepID=UPI002019AC98|nr:tumor necrosis factor ligand superfamily member 9 [Perognathus longimembris pacificus]
MDRRPDTPEAPAAPADPEAPRPPPARGPRCLRWALCAALAAGLLLLPLCWVGLLVRGCAAPPTPPPDGLQPFGAQAGSPGAPGQGQATFAKLLSKNESLANGTLSWRSEEGLRGVFRSPGLRYNESSQELVVAEAGLYFLFLRMQLRQVLRVDPPPQGRVSLTLQLEPPPAEDVDLTLTVMVPAVSSKDSGSNSAKGFWGHLVHLQGGQRLSVRLSAHLYGGAGAHRAWHLAPHPVFSLFRVTRDVPGELFM